MTDTREPVVFRQLAIPVSTFDRLKAYQRAATAKTGQHMTTIQVISNMAREHGELVAEAQRLLQRLGGMAVHPSTYEALGELLAHIGATPTANHPTSGNVPSKE